MVEAMRVVKGGGFTLLTADQIMIAVVRRCAELEAENQDLRNRLTAEFRTLRRDVRQIKRAVVSSARAAGGEVRGG